MNRIQINTAKPYEMHIGSGLLHMAAESIGHLPVSAKKICLVTDDVVDQLYVNTLEETLKDAGYDLCKFVFPNGEQSKNLTTVSNLLEYLAEQQLTRSDMLIALGGGVVGDLTGFAAATYLRGIAFVQIPTTLLAAVDSSVGGKTGVNLMAGKNLAGAFWQPSLVLLDTGTFQTLPMKEKMNGLAEAFKSALIADVDFFHFLTGSFSIDDPADVIHLVTCSVTIKKQLVEEDERDKGARQLLNLGHTIGHGIEKCSNYSISHGYAVAAGIAIIARASASMGWTDTKYAEEIVSSLKAFGFPLACSYNANQLTTAAQKDKKRSGDDITLVIPEAPGHSRLRSMQVSQLKDFIKRGL